MQLVRIEENSRDLEAIIGSCSYPSYLHYPNRAGLPLFIAKRIRRVLNEGRNLGLVASVNDTQVGLMLAYHAAWDSDKLSVSTAKAEVFADPGHPSSALIVTSFFQALDNWTTEQGVRHVATRFPFEDASLRREAENRGFHIVDALSVQKLEVINAVPGADKMVSCRPAVPEDASAFEYDVPSLYAHSRYHADGGFEPQSLRHIYVNWLHAAFSSGADQVLVTELNGHPVGFITCYIEREYADCTGLRLGFIGLLGVLPQARGRKVGRSLINGAIKWFDAQGIQVVTVATQITNYAGLRAYQSSGFRPLMALVTYHRWQSV